MQTIAFDLDGVIAFTDERIYVEDLPVDEFNNICAEAEPNHHVIRHIRELVDPKYSNVNAVIITGRFEYSRDVTAKWLSEYKVPINQVYMNETNSFANYFAIKLLNVRKANADVLYDDNEKVVDMVNNYTPCRAIRYERGCKL